MTSVWDTFVLILAIVQLYLRLESDIRRQSVTEPKPMSSPINYPAVYNYVINFFLKEYLCLLFIALFLQHDPNVEQNLETVGKNKGHMDYLEKNYGIHMVSNLEIRNTPRPKSRSRNMNYEKM